jgi:hypothetical protein
MKMGESAFLENLPKSRICVVVRLDFRVAVHFWPEGMKS